MSNLNAGSGTSMFVMKLGGVVALPIGEIVLEGRLVEGAVVLAWEIPAFAGMTGGGGNDKGVMELDLSELEAGVYVVEVEPHPIPPLGKGRGLNVMRGVVVIGN